jgi:putative restriction endonuclease
MKFYVGITDQDWFDYLRAQPGIDEVNFWKPSAGSTIRTLQPGGPFLFKLHSPLNFIAGGGFFARWVTLPISLAWDAFREKNGAGTFEQMRESIVRYRKQTASESAEFQIGCAILEQPFFFDKENWIPTPDWPSGIQTGKYYDSEIGAGKLIWEKVQIALAGQNRVAQPEAENGHPEYGDSMLFRPRLGQGSFRVLVTEAYNRACAISGEHTLPVLDAAHIKPFPLAGHKVSNGILLRSDIHRLFDNGYITIRPDYRVQVSRRIREEFENGRSYYPYDHKSLANLPQNPLDLPAKEYLEWHNERVFRE